MQSLLPLHRENNMWTNLEKPDGLVTRFLVVVTLV